MRTKAGVKQSTYMGFAAAVGVARTGEETWLVGGIPPKRRRGDDPSSSWKVPQRDDYPDQQCPPPDERLNWSYHKCEVSECFSFWLLVCL